MISSNTRLGVVAIVAGLLFLVVAPACGGVASACSDFCGGWKECVDSNLDVDSCEDACTSWAEDNSDRKVKAEKCSECIGQNDACSDVNRRCAADCLGIPLD